MLANKRVKGTGAALLIAVALLVANSAWAMEAPVEARYSTHCVNLKRIDRSDIVDDSNILFYMKDGKIYRNRLPHRCPGLKAGDTFMYRTSLNQLCDMDIITVLDHVGFGFIPGPSCGLGNFFLVTKEEASALKKGDVVLEDEAE